MDAAIKSPARAVSARVLDETQDKDLRWIVVWVGVAFVLRLLFVIAATRPSYRVLNDAFFYHTIAESLVNGHGFSLISGASTAAWPPGYPFVLAGLYGVFGQHVVVGEVFNALVSTATVPLLYLLARDAFGKTEARFASAAFALMPSQIFWSGVLITEAFAVFLTVFFMLLVVRLPAKTSSYLILGAVAGASALVRGENLFLIVIPLAIWWRQVHTRETLRRVAITVLAAAVVILPWTIRNAVTMDSFIPIANNASATLWAGHNPKANGRPNYPSKELLSHVKGTGSQREINQAKFLQDEALKYMRTHPGRELVLIPEKLIALSSNASQVFYFWVDPPGEKRQIAPDAANRLATAADFYWYALLAMTFASIFVFGSALWQSRLLLGAAAYIILSLFLYGFVFYGNFRYRAPIEPLMILIAAPLAARLAAFRRSARMPATE